MLVYAGVGNQLMLPGEGEKGDGMMQRELVIQKRRSVMRVGGTEGCADKDEDEGYGDSDEKGERSDVTEERWE